MLNRFCQRFLLRGGQTRAGFQSKATSAAALQLPLCCSRQYWQDARGYQHFQGRGQSLTLASLATGRAPYWLGGAVALAGGYWWSCREEVPYSHRRHSVMLVSRRNEQQMGEFVFKAQLAEAEADRTLVPAHHPLSVLVQRVGQRVAAVAADGHGGGNYAHMKGLQWEYAVINSPAANAFVLPGGKVVVFTGLIQLLHGDEQELAAVLAHETGHVLARHHAERMSTMNVFSLLSFLVRAFLGLPLPGLAMYLGVFLPYSRLSEHEADLIGLHLMARACYDPAAAPSMLQKLNEHEHRAHGQAGAAVPALLRTHPLTTQRVERVTKVLPEAYKDYQDAGCAQRYNAGFARGVRELFGG